MNIQIEINDTSTVFDDPDAKKPKKKYEVVTALFKNGRSYPAGSIVEMDQETGKRFIATGDVKEI